jgi:DNA-binding NarL/FixJ family response regulator
VTPSDLTDRQREVAALVAQGRTSKRIAFHLGISVTRVNIHIAAIAFRVGCPEGDDERVWIALWWRKHQLDPAA